MPMGFLEKLLIGAIKGIHMEKVHLEVQQMPIEKLVGYARNPRKNDAVVDKMVESIKEFGFRIPIVARSDGSVVDGHLRLKAAKALGMTEVPVAIADDLTDTQIKAFRLLANQSANWAEWDEELLKLELEDLKADEFDIDLIGFDESMTQEIVPVNMDDFFMDNDTPKEPKTKTIVCPHCGEEFEI